VGRLVCTNNKVGTCLHFHRCDRSRFRLSRLFLICDAFLPIPGNRSTAERQRRVDGPVNRSPRSRRAARAGPADGSSRRCVDPAWFWFSSGSRACADKQRYGKDNGRSSSGYMQQPAGFSACFWSGCSDFLVRILPRHIVQMISEGSVSGLAKKDGDFLSRREISRPSKVRTGWPKSEASIHERCL
jgi:hypothetical protein